MEDEMGSQLWIANILKPKMHGLFTMVVIGKDKCKALNDKAGKGQVFTSAVLLLLILILSSEKDLQWCL